MQLLKISRMRSIQVHEIFYIFGTGTILLFFIPLIFDAFLKSNTNLNSSFASCLKTSNSLLIAHISCICGTCPLIVDALCDLYMKISTLSIIIRPQDQIIFILAFTIPSVIFIFSQSETMMPFYYVAMINSKDIVLIMAVYNAIHKEMTAKSPRCLYNFFFLLVLWMIASVINSYTFYFDLPAAAIIAAQSLAVLSMVTGIYNLSFWFHVVASQQGRKWIDIKLLSIDEYTCLVHSFALLFYALSITFWHLTHSDTAWKNRKEDALIFQMVTYYLFLLVVTLFPGRIVRMVAMSNMKSLDLKQTFVRHVSHEIRSPLNVVHAGLEILRSELVFSASSAALELIDDIYSASETAIDILNDLLHYEHMDAGTFNLELSWRPLFGFLKDKLHWATILAEKSNVNLQIVDSTIATAHVNPLNGTHSQCYDIESSLSMIRSSRQSADEDCDISQLTVGLNIDVYKIDQVIRNLITNAIKFTPAGGTVTVKISCEIQNTTNTNNIVSRVGVEAVGLLRVEVTDTGAGIAPTDQQKVFGEFTQFNRNQLQGGGGSGLGLWISRRIVHLHQGSMGFTSEGRGKGSTFFFEVPLYSATSDQTIAAIESQPSSLETREPLPHRTRHFNRKSAKGRTKSSAEFTPLVDNTSSNNGTIIDAKNDDIQFDLNEHTEVHFDSDGFGVLSAKGKAIRRSMNLSDELRNFSHHSMTGDLADFNSSSNHCDKNKDINHQDDPMPLPATRKKSILDDIAVVPTRKKSEAAMLHAMLHNASRIHVLNQNTRSSFFQEPPPIPFRFLIVDDSSLNRRMLVRLIETEKTGRFINVVIREADDGLTAVEAVRAAQESGESFDYILMDFIMINMHGPQAAGIIRKDLKYTRPIIGVTGNALPEDIAKFIAGGANKVLTKPLTKAKLFDALMTV
mmetsp:Transcript_16569/g.24082  ORF Transcript_16569/g.24082 Transcript_16569/m.24082 type:complete len:910 (+) Transcript_16569:10-2739(+)